MTSIWWLRRDLRLDDNPALVVAAAEGEVLPLFVRDPQLAHLGKARRSRLEASLASLDASTGGALVIRSGDPGTTVAAVAREAGARSVHVTGEFTPYARRRDREVAERLGLDGVAMHSSGTPYAVRPGTVVTGQGTPYKVFTPFGKAWRDQAVAAPVTQPAALRWSRTITGERLDRELLDAASRWEPAGEQAALERWRTFLDSSLADYADGRDRPDLAGTSGLSTHLKYGEIHPRTLLRDLALVGDAQRVGAHSFVNELAWREFYADVLWHRPASAWHDLRELSGMDFDEGPGVDELVEAWCEGRTGFPFVDAGMRQLQQTGWMHNRLRMVTASFLVKDLHVRWQVGARHFLIQLLDADIASNNHGWQWVAGTGTDAAPYFRVFNPVTQGKRLDPRGDFVRRWVPELAHLEGAAAHEPWRHAEGYVHGYCRRILDHSEERREALERYSHARRSME
ncbi:cryptochrome/photolyase family protein [Nocardioides alcanivorans]|uniref:cryptochrome/photolyase family protein n=1 Tax=Nocardioides alcanivorans TaxID=2897352 RepID=UPI001F24E086|nr:deoxyribodipyrimidine photo-lyase [Nocardioides alcanivorans]